MDGQCQRAAKNSAGRSVRILAKVNPNTPNERRPDEESGRCFFCVMVFERSTQHELSAVALLLLLVLR